MIFNTLKNREILVSEWNFEYSLRRKAARKSEFNLEPFASRLEWLQDEMLKLSRLTRVDQSLYPYTLLAVQNKALTSTNVNVRYTYDFFFLIQIFLCFIVGSV